MGGWGARRGAPPPLAAPRKSMRASLAGAPGAETARGARLVGSRGWGGLTLEHIKGPHSPVAFPPISSVSGPPLPRRPSARARARLPDSARVRLCGSGQARVQPRRLD